MNAGELADRLEYWRERVCDSQDIDNDRLSMSGFANIAFNNTREILKCLRFAADMERLESCCENIRIHRNGGGWYVDADRLDEANIHSVGNHRTIDEAVAESARNAVETLEGK